MKNLLFAFTAALLLTSCASLSPVGKWDYKIIGTPQGDYSGVMTVAKKEKTLTADMKSESGDLPFNKFDYLSKSKKATGDFNYMGMTVNFDAAVTENDMTGTVSTQGMSFPFKAVRKKEIKK
ncbi:MAG: hypothetical protein JST43_10730 [Bacteroidetes bacterium]|nr:hypothetical protein [Bacteroidota bacterium]MBS1540143.1 hypothetical protein [Bacteroidota bacterium]